MARPRADAPRERAHVEVHAPRPDAPLARPLALRPQGRWEPADSVWAEDDEVDPIVHEVLDAGPRDPVRDGQVIPGEDGDHDPIAEAAELNRYADSRAAVKLLEWVLEQDHRCIDAWAHLGVVALNQDRPAVARPHYETAVAIGEQAITKGFDGVLSWGLTTTPDARTSAHVRDEPPVAGGVIAVRGGPARSDASETMQGAPTPPGLTAPSS